MDIQIMRQAIHEGMLARQNDMWPVRAGVMTRAAIAEAALTTMLLRTLSKPELAGMSDAEMLVIALDAIAAAEQITGRSLGTHLSRYLAVARQLISAATRG